jgi:hypothetical protein
LAERWRKPIVPLAIEPHEKEILVLPDGRSHRQAMLALRPEDMERLRSGFACLKCFEPFEQAWPERCHVCGAPVRREQASFFARELGPAMQVGPRTTLEEERAGLAERAAKEREREEQGNGS